MSEQDEFYILRLYPLLGFHSRDFLHNNHYHKIDNETNILSNKLCALQRNAPKDVADILFVSFQYGFNWMDIVEDAKQKDTWVNDQDFTYLKKCLNIIAKDILMAADNSLCK